jgi:hypothetical protein
VDVLAAKWDALAAQEKAATSLLQIKMDNGPESSGRRTQFLHRMVQFADDIHKPIQLLYYPPYHSKYHPSERCWGILELKWNGTKLIDAKRLSRRNREIFGGRALVAPKRPMQQKRCSVEFWHYEALKTNTLWEMKPVDDTL